MQDRVEWDATLGRISRTLRPRVTRSCGCASTALCTLWATVPNASAHHAGISQSVHPSPLVCVIAVVQITCHTPLTQQGSSLAFNTQLHRILNSDPSSTASASEAPGAQLR